MREQVLRLCTSTPEPRSRLFSGCIALFPPILLLLLLAALASHGPSSRALTRDIENSAASHQFANSGAEWYVEKVDTVDDVGWHTSLALDKAGHPHISYYDVTSGTLKYARYTEAAWQVETVDTGGNAGKYTSLALDDLDHPHISFYDVTSGTLRYARHTGTTWQVETVDAEGNVGQYTSLALDDLGYPHISYFDVTGTALKYAWHDGADWWVEEVDNSGYVGQYSSLALDGSGHPHISYLSGVSLAYAWNDGVTWYIDIVHRGANLCEWGYDSSLALDKSERPHIIYRGAFYCGELRYAWFDGNAWQTEWVPTDFLGAVGDYASLALDDTDRPHIGFYQGSNDNDLKYGWRDETGWHLETVDSTGKVGHFVSIALDREMRPHISYYDFTDGDLKHAHRLPALLLHKHAMPVDGLLNNDCLTYTLTISGPALDVYLWDPLPGAVVYISGSLGSTLSPPPVYSTTVGGIIWQGTLPTDTVAVISYQVTPGITGTGSVSLSLPIVNTVWLTDTRYNKSVSAMNIVNGWPVYLPLILD